MGTVHGGACVRVQVLNAGILLYMSALIFMFIFIKHEHEHEREYEHEHESEREN